MIFILNVIVKYCVNLKKNLDEMRFLQILILHESKEDGKDQEPSTTTDPSHPMGK